MPPPMDLPPPPLHPVLPPEVHIAGEEEVFFRTEDGLQIQALAHVPPEAERVAVLCHPHPLYGGTMHNALVVVVAKRLRERGNERAGWLRLNFRGSGQSGGRYVAGKGGVKGAGGAVGGVGRGLASAEVSVVGVSFGT